MNRWPDATNPWPELLASALLGTARGARAAARSRHSGDDAEALLDAAAGHALRRRAGVALVPAAPPPAPAPVDDLLTVGPAAAARADLLLALDHAGRHATPVRDLPGRRELLAEWLAAAAAGGRRLPPELVPALLDAGRRHLQLRPWIAPVGGPLAGWLADQRTDWSYAAAAAPADPAAADPGPRPVEGPAQDPTEELAEELAEDPAEELAEELAEQAAAGLRREPGDHRAAEAEAALARCPRPWPPAVVDALLAALADQLGHPSTRWRATGLCELAALGLPASAAPRVAALVERLPAGRPAHRGLAAAERLAATLQFRHEMLEELAGDR